MSSIEQLSQDIYNYQQLENKIRKIIKALDNASDRVGSLDFEIKNDFQVNNNGAAISNRTADLKREIEKTSHFLKKTILPSIDSSTADARRQKQQLEEEAAS